MSTKSGKDESLTLFGRGLRGHITVTVSKDYAPNMLVSDDGRTCHARALEDIVKMIDDVLEPVAP